MTPEIRIVHEISQRVGTNVRVRVVPRNVNRLVYDICIGDGGPNSFATTWDEGQPLTPEIVDAWCNEYRLLQIYGGPRVPAPVAWEAGVHYTTNATLLPE